MTVASPFLSASPDDLEWQAIEARHQEQARARGLNLHYAREAVGVALAGDELADHAEQARQLSAAGVLYGPDCSQYQGRPSWSAARAAGALIGGYKVSEGRTYEDPSHAWNKAQTVAAGLQPLAYHYLYFSAEYAANPALWAAQAAFFCSKVDPKALHVLDVEAAATVGDHLGVREWVAEYRRHFPDHALGVYSNRAMWQNRSRMPYDPAGLFDYVWHAGVGNGYYTSAKGTIAQQWAGTGSLSNSFAGNGYPACKLWQITDHAVVPGVPGTCDGNAFQGSLADLKALVLKGDAEPLKPPQPPKPPQVAVDGVLGEATVKRWQSYLNAHGASPKLAVDGVLGVNTWKAVQLWLGILPIDGTPERDMTRALQRLVGVTVDGILGADTIKGLQRYLNGHR